MRAVEVRLEAALESFDGRDLAVCPSAGLMFEHYNDFVSRKRLVSLRIL